MLTSDLVRASCRSKRVIPSFIDCSNPALVCLAHRILELFRTGIGQRRCCILEEAEPILAACHDRKLADGLFKLAVDRSDFSPPEDRDYPAARARVFLRAAELLRAGRLPADYASVRSSVLASLARDAHNGDAPPRNNMSPGAPSPGGPCVPPQGNAPRKSLYADLPEFEILRGFKTTYDRELLERYNVSLVQSLLLFADGMQITIRAKTDPALLRRFFQFLKFFRLLFDAEYENHTKKRSATDANEYGYVRLDIDGPSAVLEHSAKYGLQLASFFPVVCRLPEWSLTAQIHWRNSTRVLKLDQSSGLVSHYANYTAYRPEELSLFADSFRSVAPGWSLDESPGWIPTGGQKLLFPDFTFTAPSGVLFPMEVFHHWHARQLAQRLVWCEDNPGSNLILAVDRSLVRKNPTLRNLLDSSSYFLSHGILFHDFPPSKATYELLSSLLP